MARLEKTVAECKECNFEGKPLDVWKKDGKDEWLECPECGSEAELVRVIPWKD